MTGFHIPGGSTMYARNVSNGENTTSCPVGVSTVLPLLGLGGANFNTRNSNIPGKLEFDDTYNSGKGGIITYEVHPDSYFECRLTYKNLSAANTEAVFRVRLVDTLADPDTGIFINSAPVEIKTTKEQTVFLSFYGGGIDAFYPLCQPDVTSNIQLTGFLVSCIENR